MYPLIGEPLYPELWRGFVGAWAPCLGPTGLTLRDWSGFGNHGTLTNGPTFATNAGRYALSLDGSDDYVSLTSGSVRPANITVAAWIYVTSAAGTGKFGGVAYSFATTTPSGDDWSLSEFNGSIRVSSAATYHNGMSGTITRNSWVHVAMTRAAGATPKAYIDGSEVSLSGGISLGGGWTAGAAVGRWFASSAYCLQGAVDDVRIFDRVLTEKQIRMLASRRGISYELAPRRKARLAAFRAYWATRKAQIIGGGL
jgi:hypothetical protein